MVPLSTRPNAWNCTPSSVLYILVVWHIRGPCGGDGGRRGNGTTGGWGSGKVRLCARMTKPLVSRRKLERKVGHSCAFALNYGPGRWKYHMESWRTVHYVVLWQGLTAHLCRVSPACPVRDFPVREPIKIKPNQWCDSRQGHTPTLPPPGQSPDHRRSCALSWLWRPPEATGCAVCTCQPSLCVLGGLCKTYILTCNIINNYLTQ